MQSTVTENSIREQAYYLWEQSGRPEGRELEFWAVANDMIAAAAQLSTVKAKKPRQKSATAAKSKKAAAA